MANSFVWRDSFRHEFHNCFRFDLLSAGRNEDQIADDLVLSVETVRSHVKSLHRTRGVHTRTELLDAVRRLREPADGTA